MNKQDIYEIREWVKQELELAHTSNPPTFPMKVKVLEKILVMTTEVQQS